MRIRMGKGQVLVFDTFVEKKIETMRAELGFYPTLKKIGENCVPPQSSDCVFRSLRRLAAAGKLSAEAMTVYNAKNNLKNKEVNAHEKISKTGKGRKGKTAK